MDKQTQAELLGLVKCNYEEIAGEFDETRKKVLRPELIKLTDGVKDGDRVLDVGCGNGRLVDAFLGKDIEYVGLDNSERLIGIAKNRKQTTDDRRQKFYVGDVLELNNIVEDKFDYIFCIAILHHLPGQDLRIKALEQMKAKLKPGGKIILTVWNLWSQAKFRPLIFKHAMLKLIGQNKMDFGDIIFQGFGKESLRYYHAFTSRELTKIIDSSGLTIDRLNKDKYNYYAVLKI